MSESFPQSSAGLYRWLHLMRNRHRNGLIGGLVLFLLILVGTDLSPGHPEVTRTAAVATLMAIWWLTEAIPIAATALVPVALFPLLGIMKGKAVAGAYFNHIIFLFIGGFIMALAMERWELHRRISLKILLWIGTTPRRLLLGFMLATAFLSMWISNTATTMMMTPIAMAVLLKFKENHNLELADFGPWLLIGIAYSASIGGMATLIGTPPNMAFIKIYQTLFPQATEISFAQWLGFGGPYSLLFLLIAWLYLGRRLPSAMQRAQADPSYFQAEYRKLGPMSFEQKTVGLLFAALAIAWMTRKPIATPWFTVPSWSSLLPNPKLVDDGTVAIIFSLLLFLIPSRQKPGEALMNWKTASRLNWGIVILFGGGFALAAGFKESGLSTWIAQQLHALAGVPNWFIVLVIATLLTFLTELTSNTATTQIVLPILGSLALALSVNPLLLMIPATLSASCAFMLPVATPPNAIIFGTGEVRMSQMIRIGIVMNLIGIILVTLVVMLYGRIVFNF